MILLVSTMKTFISSHQCLRATCDRHDCDFLESAIETRRYFLIVRSLRHHRANKSIFPVSSIELMYKTVSNVFKLDNLLEYLRRDNRHDILFVSNNFCRRWNFIREKKKEKERKKNEKNNVVFTIWIVKSSIAYKLRYHKNFFREYRVLFDKLFHVRTVWSFKLEI